MEITNTKIRENGFKVTPEWLEAVRIDLENWPTLSEASKAKKEANILLYQEIDLFISNPVKWVLEDAERRHNKEYSEFFNKLNAFNYGYILGKRAERSRRKKAKQS